MKTVLKRYFLFLSFLHISFAIAQGIVVLETDFGLTDGAVSEMKGVIYSVDQSLVVSDITHEINPFNIEEAAYRLHQAAPYWPKGTVFVAVIDPGVGTKRKSIILKSKTGHYFVSPDNGTLTLVNRLLGTEEIREIDEITNRLPNSTHNTFHGRDLYAYVGAKLASSKINFEDVGPKLETKLIEFSYENATIKDGQLIGSIPIHDVRYGNAWTNIDFQLLSEYGLKAGEKYRVQIFHKSKKLFDEQVKFYNTFGNAAIGENLLYINSLSNLAISINQGSFVQKYHIGNGHDWQISISNY